MRRALPSRPLARRAGSSRKFGVHVTSVTRLDVGRSKPYTSAVPEMDVIFEPLPGFTLQAGMTEDFRHVAAL